MAQFERPDSDISNSGWVTAPLFQKVDETPSSDADFISATVQDSTAICELGLSNVTDPLSNAGHTIRVRARQGAASTSLQVELMQGALVRASFFPPSITGAPFVERSYTLSGAEADAITDYADLRIKLTANDSSSTLDTVDVSWVELEVPNAPALTITLQPRDQAKPLGTSATFTVEALSSGGALTYQWQKAPFGGAFADIGGATASSYVTPAITSAVQRSQYRCVVTDDNGPATSNAAVLTISAHDIYLRQGAVNPADIYLRDPTVGDSTTATRSIVGSGGIVFSGAAALARARAITGAGGLTFSGAAAFARSRVLEGSGGIVFSGAAQIERSSTRSIAGTGGLVFSGTADMVGTPAGAATREITGSGGIVFGGAAVFERFSVQVEAEARYGHRKKRIGASPRQDRSEHLPTARYVPSRPGEQQLVDAVLKHWELIDLRKQRRKPAKAPSAGAPDTAAASADAVSGAESVPDVRRRRAVRSPVLQIDLDAILTRKTIDHAESEAARYTKLMAAVEEVEETELLMLMAMAAAEDED